MAPRPLRSGGLRHITCVALFGILASAACGGSGPRPRPEDPRTTHTADGDSVRDIHDMAMWESLATRAAYATSARTQSLKFILDTEDDDRLYLLNSNLWDLHYSFVRAFIDPHADHARFNEVQYRTPGRRFLLGTVVHYLDGDHWTFELVAGDTLDAERIAFLYTTIRAHTFFGESLRFRPSSPSQEAAAESVAARLPTLSMNAVNADVRYQPLVVGDAYGVLRLHRETLDLATLRPNEIVVTDDVPEEISPIGALVTSRLQAPLAHVAVLSRNRRTPDMALRGAIDDPRFTALEGQLVHLHVSPQEFTLEPATLAEAEPTWANQRPRNRFVPTLDARETAIVEACSLHMDDVESAGAKASQLGELCSIGPDLVTPGGFVVPVHYDLAHRAAHGLDARVAHILTDPGIASDTVARAAALAELRAAIQAAEADRTLVAAIRARLHARPASRFILRSSTNAEDLVGFNGAGLYESIVVPADASEAAIADAVRRVWASVWLTRAYEEREWYRIDHARVAMAILVQPFVDDIVANGVAITANPFYEGRPGVFVNVQAPGGSVTGARGDEMPEQYLVYTWAEADEPELLSRSSLTHGAPILELADLLTLTDQLERIHARFLPFYAPSGNAVDVEFLLTRQHQFVFVQARAYHVEYGDGQTWRAPNTAPWFGDGPVR